MMMMMLMAIRRNTIKVQFLHLDHDVKDGIVEKSPKKSWKSLSLKRTRAQFVLFPEKTNLWGHF